MLSINGVVLSASVHNGTSVPTTELLGPYQSHLNGKKRVIQQAAASNDSGKVTSDIATYHRHLNGEHTASRRYV